MKITRDVVSDLWPAYESGEASPDTRAVVEAFLREDPELARILGGQKSAEMLRAAAVAPPPDRDKAALARTQRLIRRRQWLLGLALFLTLLPGWTVVTDDVRFVLWRDLPLLAAASLLAAAGTWAAYLVEGRRLRVKGF